MERRPVCMEVDAFPDIFRPLLRGSALYDSSCSPAARVYYIDRDGGYYLKTAPKGTLRKEAEMTRYIHGKGFAAEVLAYESLDTDWLLTSRLRGEDCVFPMYLEDPLRLSAILGERLRMLHECSFQGCPIPERTAQYLETARRNHEKGQFDLSFFPASRATVEDVWKMARENGPYLKTDTLLHGDYCLPNVMLDNWQFSGFIDLDNGGVGDRHVDLYWGIWTLNHNLKTPVFGDRFLDAYGRDKINEDIIPVIGAIEVFG